MCLLHLKVMTYNSPFLKSGLHVVLFFNKYTRERDQKKKKSNFTAERPDEHYLQPGVKININSVKSY